MNAPRIASLVAALILTAPITLVAQQEPIVAPGVRVRVRAPSVSRDRLVGTVLALGADTCVLEVETWAEPLALPLASLERLEVSRGRKWNAGKAALRGGLVGTVIGLALTIPATIRDCDHEFLCFEATPADVLAVSAILGGVGAGVGLLMGAMSTIDRWEEVPLDQLRVGPAPGRDPGFTLSVSLRL